MSCVSFIEPVVENHMKSLEANELEKETQILNLLRKNIKDNDSKGFKSSIENFKIIVLNISKAKASKLIKEVIELLSDISSDFYSPISLCEDFIAFAEREQRVYLTQTLKTKQLFFLYKNMEYSKALQLAGELIKQLRKIDDKELLIDVFLLESKIYFEIKNFSKSKASLTSARTISNSIYISPKFQAQLDLHAGALHLQDKDYRTGYSYFYESFEACCNFDKDNSQKPLIYMVLCKLMLDSSDEAMKILSDKCEITKDCKIFDVLKNVATASKLSSLKMLQKCLDEDGDLLKKDTIVNPHIQQLYDDLFEKNILKISKAYNRVEISHLAHIISLQPATVQTKLSQMILDNKLSGVLDQGAGVFELWEEDANDDDTTLFDSGIELISSMSKIVDVLFVQNKNLR